MARGAAAGWGSNVWCAAILFTQAAWTLSHERRAQNERTQNQRARSQAHSQERADHGAAVAPGVRADGYRAVRHAVPLQVSHAAGTAKESHECYASADH